MQVKFCFKEGVLINKVQKKLFSKGRKYNTLGLINSLQFLGFENVIISKFYFWDFNSHDDFTGPLIIPIIEGLLYYDLKKE